MPPLPNLFGIGAREHFDHVIHAHPEPTPLTNSINAGKKFLGCYGAIESLARREAIIAISTVVAFELLPEIAEQECSPASGRIRKMRHPLQLLPSELLLGGT